ncbi:hypothetical protein ACOSQ3_014509 [Xanthoceras sorbifolium]
MDQGSSTSNPPNPNTNTAQTSINFQQQIDQLSQTFNIVMHCLDVIDEHSSCEGGRVPKGGRQIPRRREGISDSEEEDRKVQLGRVRHRELRMVQGQPRNTYTRRNHLDKLTKRMKVELRFVKLKLKGPARVWWSSVEERLRRTHQLDYEDMLQWNQSTKTTVDQYTERFHELTVRRPQCYKCKRFGHFAIVCPTRD